MSTVLTNVNHSMGRNGSLTCDMLNENLEVTNQVRQAQKNHTLRFASFSPSRPLPLKQVGSCIRKLLILSISLFFVTLAVLWQFAFPYESTPSTLIYRTHTIYVNETHKVIPFHGKIYFPIKQSIWVRGDLNNQSIFGLFRNESTLYSPLMRLGETAQQFVYRRPSKGYKCSVKLNTDWNVESSDDSIARVLIQEEEDQNFKDISSSTIPISAATDLSEVVESHNEEENSYTSFNMIDSKEITFETSKNGDINFEWYSPSQFLQDGWNEFEIECRDQLYPEITPKTKAYVWHEKRNSRGYACVSDIDDTIKITEVKQPIGLLQNVFFKQFRPTHHGLSKVYRKFSKHLAQIDDGESDIPFHYVSSSPYGLHDALVTFLKRFGFPLGTLHLKKAAFQDLTMHNLFKSSRFTKPPLLRNLLETYSERKFLLIGDSSEHDPMIYGNLYREYGPERIILIAIHCVKKKQCLKKRISKDFEGIPEDRYIIFTDDLDLEKKLISKGIINETLADELET